MVEVIALATIFSIPLIIVFIKNTLWDLYYWQIKEYRWDRFWTHLRWDLESFNRSSYSIGFKFILFSSATLLFVVPIIGLGAVLLTYILWTYQSFNFIQNVLRRDFVHPSFRNPRNLLILFFMVFALIIVIAIITAPFIDVERNIIQDTSETISSLGGSIELISISDIYVLLGLLTLVGLILDLASPIIVPIFVVFTEPISMLKRWGTVRKARIKLKRVNPKLTIIAITGSQGKTTTKELLYELLKDEYKTVKTPENFNTDVGVANTILSSIKDDTEVFIAEMGAYRKGEIAKIAKNFKPDISVITDIDTQHLGLFGSKQRLLNAKYEIVDHLKEGGIAILNGEDNRDLIKKDKQNDTRTVFTATNSKYVYKFSELVDGKTDFLVTDVTNKTSDSVTIEVTGQDIDEKIKVKNIPETYVSNLTLAIAVARELNIPIKKIKSTLENFDQKLPRLQKDSGDNGTIIINDSYSSSRKGFIAAVKEMKKYSSKDSKNIVITKGILELGKHKDRVYDELMDEIAKTIDVLITSDSKLADAAKKDNEHMNVIKANDNNQIIYNFRNESRPGDVVLLEGRLHPDVLKEIISDDEDGKL